MDRRNTWARSLIGVGLLAAAALPGCGSSTPSNSPAPSSSSTPPAAVTGTPTDDLSVSNRLSVSMAPVDDQGTFAVVDGTAPGDQGSVKATLRIGDFDGDLTSYDLPIPPLLYPTAWAADDTVYVQGQACTKPLMDQVGEGDTPDQACESLGGATLTSFDIETSELRVISSDLPDNEFGNLTVTPGPTFTLLESYVPATPPPGKFELSRLDNTTGATQSLGTAPGTDLICAGPHGFIGLVSAITVGSNSEPRPQLDVVVIDDGGIEQRQAPSPPADLAFPLPAGCTEDGQIAFPGSAGDGNSLRLGLDADGTPIWAVTNSAEPPGDGTAPIYVPGGELAWEPTGDTGVSYAGWIPYLLEDGTWVAHPMVPGPDSPSTAAISGSHLLALSQTGPQDATLIVR